MTRFLKNWAPVASLLFAPGICCAGEVFPVVHNQPVVVRVLDGKSGDPQARRRVALTGGYDQRDLDLGQWHEEALTDNDGNVRLSNELRNLPLLHVEVLQSHACEPNANHVAVSVEQVRLNGLSGANRCGTAVAVNAPGVLNVFVKGNRGSAPAVLASAASVLAPPVTPALIAAAAPATTTAPRPLSISTALPVSSKEPDASTAAGENEPVHAPANRSSVEVGSIASILSFPYEGSFADVSEPPPSPASVLVHVVVLPSPRMHAKPHAQTPAVKESSGQYAAPDATDKKKIAAGGKTSLPPTSAKDAAPPAAKPGAGHAAADSINPVVKREPRTGDLPGKDRAALLQARHARVLQQRRAYTATPDSADAESTRAGSTSAKAYTAHLSATVSAIPENMPVFGLRERRSASLPTTIPAATGVQVEDEVNPLCEPGGN